MRVALITTGTTELRGFPKALGRLFPSHEFVGVEDRPDRPFHGFTSYRLPPPPIAVPTVVDSLVATAVALVDPALAARFDLVVLIDDLELANRDQPAVVVEVVRDAARRHLARFSSDVARQAVVSEAVRNRVSFHLVRPMIESWFFGAPAALTTAGLPSNVRFHRRRGDHEDFKSTDRLYMAAQDSDCPRWSRYRDGKDRPKWIAAGADRVFHPKGYLQWLLLDGASRFCTSYGRGSWAEDALSAMDWGRLLKHPERALYARSLVADLALGLGEAPTLAAWAGAEAPETSVSVSRPAAILRNL